MLVESYNHHIPNIDALNSDTHTLRIQYEYSQKQCVGVAIEGKDIWYLAVIHKNDVKFLKLALKVFQISEKVIGISVSKLIVISFLTFYFFSKGLT